MNIGRTLYWFKDGDETLISLNEDFFGLGTLLNRLLNEKYDGKKVKFINIDFSTNKTYELFPILPKNEPYYYGGHLRYYGLFDLNQFNEFNWDEKKLYVWENSIQYIKKSADFIKNKKLLDAAEYAYNKGFENDLNPDYRLLESNFFVSEKQFHTSLWINFKENGMSSKLTIENEGKVIFEMEIDKTPKGIEFFLEMYKEMEFDGDNIIIKGLKGVDYLPLKIPMKNILF